MYRVRAVISGFQGGPGLSTTYHRASTIPTDAEAAVCAARVRGAWDVVKTILGAGVTVQVQSAVDVLEDAGGLLIGSQNGGAQLVVVGTGATGPAVAQVAAGLILNTNTIVHGRRLRGRLFISPLTASFTNTLTPAVPIQTAVNAMGVALLTAAPLAAAQPLVVWSRPVLHTTPTVPARLGSSAVATSSGTASKFFSIRSRRD
jgi:hypothetical protein